MSILDKLRDKNLHTWMRDYGRHLVRRARTPKPVGERHLLFALCDHYEPFWRIDHRARTMVGEQTGRDRVDAWFTGYPKLAADFHDSDGRTPRHGFFFPGEEYREYFLDRLADLCADGHGEVEVHLHHDGDTRETLRPQLVDTLAQFARHGHISRLNGQYRWAFIHGNWCLANGRPDGRWCGVDDELPLLHELGCYADLTFPAAPDPSQPDKVNQIYWPIGEHGDLNARRAYDHGVPARVGTVHEDRLLMITGPLAFARKGRGGIRLENGALTGDDPPDAQRVATWIRQGIHVEGKPEWVFVKVHTHGAIEKTAASLLGAGGRALHEALRSHMRDGWKLHYVTAREMFNVARAAMDGKTGDPNGYFDYVIPPPPVAL